MRGFTLKERDGKLWDVTSWKKVRKGEAVFHVMQIERPVKDLDDPKQLSWVTGDYPLLSVIAKQEKEEAIKKEKQLKAEEDKKVAAQKEREKAKADAKKGDKNKSAKKTEAKSSGNGKDDKTKSTGPMTTTPKPKSKPAEAGASA